MSDNNARFIGKHKVVIGFPPYDVATAADNSTYAKGEYINMADYNHATVIILGGASAGGTGAVNIYQATNASGGSAKIISAFTERFLNTSTSTASDTWVSTAVTASTWTHPATANISNIVEIDARDLDGANGFSWIAVNVAAAGGTTLMACIYILSEGRFLMREKSPSAII